MDEAKKQVTSTIDHHMNVMPYFCIFNLFSFRARQFYGADKVILDL